MAPARQRQASPLSAVRPAAVADRLHSAAIHLLRSLRWADRASGLTGPRLSALSVIVFRGPIRMSALALAEQVRAPTMTVLVRGLVRAGLVSQVTDPGDRRASLVRASPKGRTLLYAARRRRVSQLAVALAARSPAERRLLLRAAELMERSANRVAG